MYIALEALCGTALLTAESVWTVQHAYFVQSLIVHSFLTWSQNVDGGEKNNRQDSIDEVAIHLRFLDFMSFEVCSNSLEVTQFSHCFPRVVFEGFGSNPRIGLFGT